MPQRRYRFFSLLAIALMSLLALGPRFAQAAETPPQSTPRSTVTLVSDYDVVAPGQTVRIGLRQRLAPHWHSYWKNPGDAGAPPQIDLTLPAGAQAEDIAWPGPDRIAVGPAMNFGYEREVVFARTVTLPADAQPGQRFTVTAEARWLVCEKECIPEEGRFVLDLPIAVIPQAATGPVAASFADSDARRPVTPPWKVRLIAEGDSLVLQAVGPELTAATVKEAFFYPAEWGSLVHAATQGLLIDDGKLQLALTKGPSLPAEGKLDGLLAITDNAGRTAWYETSLPFSLAASAGSAADDLPIWKAALFALIGGLILNLMPCVFPVLAIKATSLAGMVGAPPRELRLSGLFYTLGVLTAFLALAAALLAARSAGNAVGWGFQFQSPLFVAAMSWLLLAIGLNLSGVFEIGLGMSGTGQSLAGRTGHQGSFFTGLLAVVVATPCTAPFLGAAIGSALAAPVAVSLTIFAMMGLGLALPYALLGFFPGLARRLPRPGGWMLRLRQALAFPMYASAAWLIWVLAQQAGDQGVLIGLAGSLLIGLAAWLYGIAQEGGGRSWRLRGVALLVVLALAGLVPQLKETAAPEAIAPTAAGVTAERFTAARLAELRREGRPVFVNMTAAWCITCLVNERTTLSRPSVQKAMQESGVVYLKGDWTKYDPEITAFLRSFKRDGLPFYAYYPAGGGEARLLPPVLTESLVVDQFRPATGDRS